MLKSFEEVKNQGTLNYEEFEKTRLESKAKTRKGLMMAFLIGGAILVVGLLLAFMRIAEGLILVAVGILFGFVYYYFIKKKANKELKARILGDLLIGIDPNFLYSLKDNNLPQQFKNAGFFKSSSNIYVDDVFLGKINGMDFGIGELVVKTKQGEGKTTTVFSGPFGFVETEQKFSYTTIIPDNVEKVFGGLGRLLQKVDITRLNQKLIKIEEDSDFEKYFAVWTKDEKKTKELLNEDFRVYLKGLATVNPVFAGWRDNKVYFGIDNRRDAFILKLNETISESTIRQFYEDFAKYYNILETITNYVTKGMSNTSAE